MDNRINQRTKYNNSNEHNMQKSLNTLALTLGVSLVAAVTVRAQTASESFNYGTGAGIGTQAVPGSGAFGWLPQVASVNANLGYWNSKADPNPTTEVQATSMTYAGLNTSGGSLISAGGATSGNSIPEIMLGTGVTFGSLGAANGNTLWVSYLWQGLETPSSAAGLFRQSTVMFLGGATTASGSGQERLDIGTPNISAANSGTVNPNISLWSVNGIAGGNGTLSSTAPLQSSVATYAATSFILIKFSLDNVITSADTISVWINPTLTGAEPVGAADLTWTTQDWSALNGIRISSNAGNATTGNVGGSEQIDELNIGNTVASVEAVPEPGTLAMAAIGGVAMMALIRRRK